MTNATQHDESSWDQDGFDSMSTSVHESSSVHNADELRKDATGDQTEVPMTRKQIREAQRAESEQQAGQDKNANEESHDVLHDEEEEFVSLAEEFGIRESLLEQDENTDLLNPAVVHWELIGLEKDKKGNYPSKSDLVEKPPILFVSDDQGSMAALMMTQQVAVPLYRQLTIMRNVYSGKPAVEKKPKTISEKFIAGIDYWFNHKIKGTVVVLMSAAFIYAAGAGAWSIVAGY
jgi:hypothetical protein